MQLAKFRAFVDGVKADSELKVQASLQGVYALVQTAWHDEAMKPVTDSVLVAGLTRVLETGRHWRAKNDKRAFFPITELRAAVAAEFKSAPTAPTREYFLKRLLACNRSVQDAFDAKHDELTGLHNKRSLEESLVAAFSGPVSAPSEVSPALAAASDAPLVWMLALDLDHFKQVNDTHGHLYGDLVLRCFAQRVAAVCANSATTGPSIVVARIGGEEFQVLIQGASGPTTAGTLAEQIRVTVGKEPLPSDTEWAGIPAAQKTGVTLPHPSERQVTVSIGVSSLARVAGGDARALGSRLRGEADAALYRAKAAGRDTIRVFSDILHHCGRVLEHHGEANVVAIDIGKNVQVRVGQEFLVFRPEFAGATPFVHSDGRSKKRLGTYPKIASARIVVFDAQPEIAFARILKMEEDGRLPAGSVLEAVPLGSIAHLLGGSDLAPSYAPDLLPATKLTDTIAALATTSEDFAAAVLAIDDVAEVEKTRGTAFVNDALVKALTAVRAVFPLGTLVSQIPPTQFGVLVRGVTQGNLPTTLDLVIEQIAKESAGLISVGAGYYFTSGESELPRQNALEYARYAASQEARGSTKTLLFSDSLALKIIGASRKAGNRARALADYESLKSLGVETVHACNQALLAALELGVAEKALGIAHRLMDFGDKVPVYLANVGLAEFASGDRARAYDLLLQGGEAVEKSDAYKPAFALAMLEASKAGLEVDKAKLNTLLGDSITIKPLDVLGIKPTEIMDAFFDLPNVGQQPAKV
jgi:diguanylate cyclase (GGDEF)-like protein